MPLCPDLTETDLTALYATIAELYEIIQASKVVERGQPLAKEDYCTIIH